MKIGNETKPYWAGEKEDENRRLNYQAQLEESEYLSVLNHVIQDQMNNRKSTLPLSVLMVGDGDGYFSEKIVQKFEYVKVISLDSSASRSYKAAQRLMPYPNAKAVLGDAYNLPFQDEKVDIVATRYLLEHLSEPDIAVSEMYRALKIGGQVNIYDTDGAHLFNHWPLSLELIELFGQLKTQFTSYDPNIGRKIWKMLSRLGFQLKLKDLKMSPYFPIEKLDLIEIQVSTMKEVLALNEDSRLFFLLDHYINYVKDPENFCFGMTFSVTGKK